MCRSYSASPPNIPELVINRVYHELFCVPTLSFLEDNRSVSRSIEILQKLRLQQLQDIEEISWKRTLRVYHSKINYVNDEAGGHYHNQTYAYTSQLCRRKKHYWSCVYVYDPELEIPRWKFVRSIAYDLVESLSFR